MLFSPSSSSSSDSHGLDFPSYYFTFWDMDDTSVKSCDNLIKNPHLLLPIKLFQSVAPNQQLGIMTNRSPNDLETDYTVKEYLSLLSSFGIFILDKHVLFCGGINADQRNKEHHQFEQAVDIIAKQIESLKLTDIGAELAHALQISPEIMGKTHAILRSSLLGSIQAAKYHGKNHQLLDFLNQHYNEATDTYTFGRLVCPKKALIYGIVDDLESIAAQTQILGTAFFGIQASGSGLPPTGAKPVGDYYQDDYLFKVAKKIGLAQYAQGLLTRGDYTQGGEAAIMKVAALLYAWHAFPDTVSIEDFKIFGKILNVHELECIAKMLEYISKFANTHKDAHYRDVSELARWFRYCADVAFLEWGPVRLVEIKREKIVLQARLAVETPPRSDIGPDEADTSAKKKKKWAPSFLSRTKSMRSSPLLTTSRAASSPSSVSASHESKALMMLDKEYEEILERQRQLIEHGSHESATMSSSSHAPVARVGSWLSVRTPTPSSSSITPTFDRSSVKSKRCTSLTGDDKTSCDDQLSEREEKDEDDHEHDGLHQRNSSSNSF